MGLSAVQARYENAYVHCLAVLKGLYDSAQSSGVLPDMSPAERKKALQTFLRVPFILHLYAEVIRHLLPSFLPPFAATVSGCLGLERCHIACLSNVFKHAVHSVHAPSCIAWKDDQIVSLLCAWRSMRPRRRTHYFKDALYGALVDLKATPELLAMDSPELAAYLRPLGAFPSVMPRSEGRPLGPSLPARYGHSSSVTSTLPPPDRHRSLHCHVCQRWAMPEVLAMDSWRLTCAAFWGLPERDAAQRGAPIGPFPPAR